MEKRLFALLGIIAAISIAIGIYIFVFNSHLRYKSSLEGEWRLARVMEDGTRVPNIDGDPGFIDIVYYSPRQSVIFQSGSIRGYDGCSDYYGDLKLGIGGRLNILRIVSTLEGCAEVYVENSDRDMELVTKYDSSRFNQDLLSVNRVEIRNRYLVLINDGSTYKELFFVKVGE